MSGFDWNRLGARPKNAGAVKRGGRGRQARDLSRAYAQECVASAAAAAAAPTPAPPPATSTPPASGISPSAYGTTPPASGTPKPASGTPPPASGTPQPASGTLPPAYGTNQPSSASGKKKKKSSPRSASLLSSNPDLSWDQGELKICREQLARIRSQITPEFRDSVLLRQEQEVKNRITLLEARLNAVQLGGGSQDPRGQADKAVPETSVEGGGKAQGLSCSSSKQGGRVQHNRGARTKSNSARHFVAKLAVPMPGSASGNNIVFPANDVRVKQNNTASRSSPDQDAEHHPVPVAVSAGEENVSSTPPPPPRPGTGLLMLEGPVDIGIFGIPVSLE